MVNKLIILPLLMLLLIGIIPAVNCATSVLYDDTETYWTAGTNTVMSEETSLQYYGTSCMKVIVSGGSGSLTHEGSFDFSSYDQINIYANIPVGASFGIICLSGGWSNYYYAQEELVGTGNWKLYSVPKANFNDGEGSPNWASISQVSLWSLTNSYTFYIDMVWWSSDDPQTLQVLEPIYATLVPVVGNHTYVEGQPVLVTATMLADYTFLKYSLYPVGDSTTNPTWIIMNGNYTLTTVLQAPAAAGEMAMENMLMFAVLLVVLAISVIFFTLRMPLFVLISGVIGLLINLVALGSAIPFTPYVQLLFSLIELSLVIFAAQNVRS